MMNQYSFSFQRVLNLLKVLSSFKKIIPYKFTLLQLIFFLDGNKLFLFALFLIQDSIGLLLYDTKLNLNFRFKLYIIWFNILISFY